MNATRKVPVRVILLRHGETEYNNTQRIEGHTDTPLNDKGQAQANEVAEYLKDLPINFCVSSDLSRAVKTAVTVLEKQEEKVASGGGVHTSSQLRERSWGLLEGKTRPNGEIEPEILKTVETMDALKARALSKWYDLFSNFDADSCKTGSTTMLIIAHGGTIAALVEALVGSGAVKFITEEVKRKSNSKSSIGNCSLTEIQMDGRDTTWIDEAGRKRRSIAWSGVVTRFGDDDHLSEEVKSSTDTSADIEPDVEEDEEPDMEMQPLDG